MPTPEALAREKIDALLSAAGWLVQDYKQLNLSAARGIALREVPLKTGPCDYLLLVDRVPLGVIEAKPSPIPKGLDWPALVKVDGDDLETLYRHVLQELSKRSGMLGIIFRKAQNKIQEPAKLARAARLRQFLLQKLFRGSAA